MRYALPMLVTASFLAGCASPTFTATGPAFQEVANEPGRATVYVYRLPTKDKISDIALIYLDGKRVATLNADGYSYFYAMPGRHKLSQSWSPGSIFGKDAEISVAVGAGETHYVLLFTSMSSDNEHQLYDHWYLYETNPERGRKQLLPRHFQKPDNARP